MPTNCTFSWWIAEPEIWGACAFNNSISHVSCTIASWSCLFLCTQGLLVYTMLAPTLNNNRLVCTVYTCTLYTVAVHILPILSTRICIRFIYMYMYMNTEHRRNKSKRSGEQEIDFTRQISTLIVVRLYACTLVQYVLYYIIYSLILRPSRFRHVDCRHTFEQHRIIQWCSLDQKWPRAPDTSSFYRYLWIRLVPTAGHICTCVYECGQ